MRPLSTWLDFDMFKLRGAMTYIEQTDFANTRTWISSGLLHQLDNKRAFCAEIETAVDGDNNGIRFSHHLGRAF